MQEPKHEPLAEGSRALAILGETRLFPATVRPEGWREQWREVVKEVRDTENDPIKRLFLERLEEHGLLYIAARECGYSWITFYRWRKADPEFDAAVKEVIGLEGARRDYKLKLLTDSNDEKIALRALDTLKKYEMLAADREARLAPEQPEAFIFKLAPAPARREPLPMLDATVRDVLEE